MKLASLTKFCMALACSGAILSSAPALAQLPPNATLYASGLAGPRGMAFGPDGMLYVAEAGFGGTTSTKGTCTQVVPPIGPYTNGNTGRISRIDRSGKRETVATGFPSAVSGDATHDTSSVADLAFLDGTLYAVLAGGGCSHGSASIPNAIVSVDTKSGSWKIVADLSAFLKSHPAKYPSAGDYEPDGVFYSLIAANGKLYTVEPNHGQVFSITPSGQITEEIDISNAQGHIVPTSIAERDGNFFLGNLGLFPITPDSSKILTLTKECRETGVPGLDTCSNLRTLKVTGSLAGFTTVVHVLISPGGYLYALELSAAVGYPAPGEGKVVRLGPGGSIDDVVTGLTVPTGMTFGPDGGLYISDFGAAPAGAGQIIRVAVH